MRWPCSAPAPRATWRTPSRSASWWTGWTGSPWAWSWPPPSSTWAEAHLRAAERQFRQTSNLGNLLPVEMNLGSLHHDRLELADATRRFESALALALAVDAGPPEINAQVNLALLALDDSRPEDALAALEVAEARMARRGLFGEAPWLHRARAHALRRLGRFDDAVEALVQALITARRVGWPVLERTMEAQLATACAEAGRLADARFHLATALDDAPDQEALGWGLRLAEAEIGLISEPSDPARDTARALLDRVYHPDPDTGRAPVHLSTEVRFGAEYLAGRVGPGD